MAWLSTCTQLSQRIYEICPESTVKTLGADDKTTLTYMPVPCFIIITTRRFGETITVNFPSFWKSYYELYIQLSWLPSASVYSLLRKVWKSNCLSTPFALSFPYVNGIYALPSTTFSKYIQMWYRFNVNHIDLSHRNGCFIRLDSAEVTKSLSSPSLWKASQGTSSQIRTAAVINRRGAILWWRHCFTSYYQILCRVA